jgi:hypothetical protein
MRKRKKKRLSSEEIAALMERVEAGSLQPGDEKLISAILEKTFTLQKMVREDRIPKKRWLQRYWAIPRPKRSDE